MTFYFRIGKKKLGISEVVVGRPLFILNEIYSTEKTYVNNLNALVTVYQEPMQGMIFHAATLILDPLYQQLRCCGFPDLQLNNEMIWISLSILTSED